MDEFTRAKDECDNFKMVNDLKHALATGAAAISPAALQVAPGFKVELIYTVPKEDQGSWVALTVDPKGRIYAGDQYGAVYRLTVPPLGSTEGTKVEKLAITLPAAVLGADSEPLPPPPKKVARSFRHVSPV